MPDLLAEDAILLRDVGFAPQHVLGADAGKNRRLI